MKCMIHLLFMISCWVLSACELYNEEAPGALVPPAADEDPMLPQLRVQVAGHERILHLQTFGDPENPPIFVLHGGPGGDFRLLLPLKALADQFHVILWDSRGAGLSERVTKEELSIDSFDEEVARVKMALVPDRPVICIGHSFGANVLLRYAAHHPEDVAQLILLDPGQIDHSVKIDYKGGAVSFLDGQDFFWQNEILTSKDHASADYKAIEILPKSSRNWTCDKHIIENYPFWRFGAYHYYIVQLNTFQLPDDFNWASGIENFKGNISIIAGTCGALSESFQRKYNLETLTQADLQAIPDAGHISLFTDYADQTIAAIRSKIE